MTLDKFKSFCHLKVIELIKLIFHDVVLKKLIIFKSHDSQKYVFW